MSSAPPVIFLSFANNDTQPLLNLKEEGEAIYNILISAENEQRIKIHREPFATIRNTTQSLNAFGDRIILFHYGGHANRQTLLFNDQAANAQGFAQQLALLPSLKLVILNGCSTKKQVALLLQLGIPAVIATSNSIPDNQAIQFSETFYTALVAGKKLKKAFKTAAAVIQTMSGKKPSIYRDTGFRAKEESIELPWGLYTNGDAILSEKIIPAAKKTGRKKNVLEDADLDIGQDVHIGNINSKDKTTYDEENVVKMSKIKTKGSFRLGNDS